jgi:hypothetical protein
MSQFESLQNKLHDVQDSLMKMQAAFLEADAGLRRFCLGKEVHWFPIKFLD